MSSINQLVSEIAHVAQSPNNIALKRSIKQDIIHYRNELIRKSYNNHNITDKVLQQRFKLTLIDVPDGDLFETLELDLYKIKRTKQKVPRPTRLNHNIPFHSVRTAGIKNPIEISFVKEASSAFYNFLPGMCNNILYDYINEYIYIDIINKEYFNNLQSIIVESVFEYPHLIKTETIDNIKDIDEHSIDDDEFLLPEDMIGAIKELILKRLHLEVPRETNEIPITNKVNG